MTKYNSPCLGCDKRYIGCHSYCARYKLYRMTVDAERRKRREQADEEEFIRTVSEGYRRRLKQKDKTDVGRKH